MSETTSETLVPAALPAPVVSAPGRRSGSGPALVIGLLAIICAGYALWRVHSLESDHESVTAIDMRLEALTHSVEQLRGNADTLRVRMDDGAKVDKSEREELLGLSERARLLEDAVANLADKRLSGHDALLLNEAEMLLTLGGERYTLFHDGTAAIAAYRLADTALSQVEDAAFSTVRQSVDAEIAALGALQATNTAPIAAQLAQLRAQLPQLPAATRMPATETPVEPPSGLWRVLGAFVQVHHGEDVQTRLALRDVGLARELAALDLRDAEAALLARDDAQYRDALAAARAQMAAFDQGAPAVVAALTRLDDLNKAVLAPPPPELLGAALKELRNLRATHALRAPTAPGATGAQP